MVSERIARREVAVVETDWPALRKAGPESMEAASEQAYEIARAIAIETLAVDQDSVLAELSQRVEYLCRASWPDEPLDGYELQSSLGGFIVARLAVAWVPSGQIGLRHSALDREGMLRALEAQGVSEVMARRVIGDWLGPTPGFVGNIAGLPTGLLAGLAERSLTKKERTSALDQIAVSGRDLRRLCAVLLLNRTIRQLLAVLPDKAFGLEFSGLLALVATGHAERVVPLVTEEHAKDLSLKTVNELAIAIQTLRLGQVPQFDEDDWVCSSPKPQALAYAIEDEQQESFAEIQDDSGLDVEQENAADSAPVISSLDLPVDEKDEKPNAEVTSEDFDDSAVSWQGKSGTDIVKNAWQKLYETLSLAVRRGALLGLLPEIPNHDEWLVAPDALWDRRPSSNSTPSIADPFLTPVRGAVRMLLAALEGEVPTLADIENAGPLRWFVIRCAALAHIKNAQFVEAQELLRGWPMQCVELRWVEALLMRQQHNEVIQVDAQELRQAGAQLIEDLAVAVGRTLTGLGLTGLNQTDDGEKVEAPQDEDESESAKESLLAV